MIVLGDEDAKKCPGFVFFIFLSYFGFMFLCGFREYEIFCFISIEICVSELLSSEDSLQLITNLACKWKTTIKV